MFSSISTLTSFSKFADQLIVLPIASNLYNLPTPTIYIPFRDSSIANYASGTASLTGISTTNNPNFISGIIGNSQALRFDKASSQYLTLPNQNMSNIGSKFSVSLWVKLALNPSAGVSNIWCISNYQQGTTSTNKYTWALFYSGGKLRFEYARDGSVGLVRRGKEISINLDQWYHIVCIQKSDNSMEMYIDNTRNSASLSGTNNSTTPNFAWTSVLHQCAKSSYNADPYLSCDLDDFRFYPGIELTDANIKTLYDSRTNATSDYIQ